MGDSSVVHFGDSLYCGIFCLCHCLAFLARDKRYGDSLPEYNDNPATDNASYGIEMAFHETPFRLYNRNIRFLHDFPYAICNYGIHRRLGYFPQKRTQKETKREITVFSENFKIKTLKG